MRSRDAASPTVLRWELGRRLRELRERSGKSLDDVAQELMCSAAKISRMETAGRGIQARDVRDLCRFFGLSKIATDELLAMCRDAKQPGWWQDYRTIDEQTLTYVGLEEAATRLTVLEVRALPGQTQTTAYATALLTGLSSEPPSAPVVGEMVETRQRRANRLRDGALELESVVDESVFHRTFGDPAMLADQIHHLLGWIELPNVSLQVLPFTAPPNPSVHSSFSHLTFPNHALPDIVYIESLRGHFLLDRATDVEKFFDAFTQSRDLALSAADSVTWLQSQAAALRRQARRQR